MPSYPDACPGSNRNAFARSAPAPESSGRPVRGPAKNNAWEAALRARIPIEFARRGRPWKAFKPARWYPADWQDGSRDAVVLRDGRATAAWPAAEVEIRTVADDEWEILSAARMDIALEGQTFQIPGRIAECPEGHTRSIPTRFDAAVVQLKCAGCGRVYRLASAPPP